MTRENYETQSGKIMADVPEDADNLNAENALYEALRHLQDYRQSQNYDDITAAHVAAMRACFAIENTVEDTPEENTL